LFGKDLISVDLSILVWRYAKSEQSFDVHLDTSADCPPMQHKQYLRIAFALALAFCLPRPDRKGYKGQSVKVQFVTPE
jgi:hypothetical protein